VTVQPRQRQLGLAGDHGRRLVERSSDLAGEAVAFWAGDRQQRPQPPHLRRRPGLLTAGDRPLADLAGLILRMADLLDLDPLRLR
jgi:hypothetical protein